VHWTRVALTVDSPVARTVVVPYVPPWIMTSAPATKPVPVTYAVTVVPRAADTGEMAVTVGPAGAVTVKPSSSATHCPPGFRSQTV